MFRNASINSSLSEKSHKIIGLLVYYKKTLPIIEVIDETIEMDANFIETFYISLFKKLDLIEINGTKRGVMI